MKTFSVFESSFTELMDGGPQSKMDKTVMKRKEDGKQTGESMAAFTVLGCPQCSRVYKVISPLSHFITVRYVGKESSMS